MMMVNAAGGVRALLLFALLAEGCAFVGQGLRLGSAPPRLPLVSSSQFAQSRLRVQPRTRPTWTCQESRKAEEKSGTDAGVPLQLQLLLSRRKLLAVASAASAGLVLSGRASAQTQAPPSKPAQTGTAKSPLIVDYNKAPGKLIVYPDGVVEKSPNDKYQYRALTLPNGLRVLLASDPKADTAAAALDVHVGHFSDPDDVPGLAHFNEHMLFLGNKKYPEEGSLETFLSSHGGSSNAYTASEDTCYFFSVNQDALLPALERFSQFFVSPLFTASATGRELNAIESEHSKNLQQDSWRLNQLTKTRANPRHPYAKFGTGNRQTLKEGTESKGIDLREQLLQFYNTYYSANQMTLAVCGRESLDTLQDYIVSLFSPVPNRDVPPPEAAWAGLIPPYVPPTPSSSSSSSSAAAAAAIPSVAIPAAGGGAAGGGVAVADAGAFGREGVRAAAGEVYCTVPVDDVREMSFCWVWPFGSAGERAARRAAKPEQPVAAVLGYEGPGSLLSYLKDEKGWVSSLGAAVVEETSDFQVFGVIVSLTPEGLRRRDAIGDALFGYLSYLRAGGGNAAAASAAAAAGGKGPGGLPDYILDEVVRTSELFWRFRERRAPSDVVGSAAADMQAYSDPREYLAGPGTVRRTPESAALAARLLAALRPEEALVTVTAREFAERADRAEPIYGTRYFTEPAGAKIAAWAAARPAAALTVPPPNPFIPDVGELTLKFPATEDLAAPTAGPDMIRDDEKWQVHYKPDKRYGQPKAYAFFQVTLPDTLLGATTTPRTSALAKLYKASLSDALTEFAYPAAVAGLQYSLDFTPRGAQLQFAGFSPRLPAFIAAVAARVAAHVPPADEARFRRYRDVISRDLRGFDTAQPYQHAVFYAKLCQEMPSYEPRAVDAELQTITPAELRAWAAGLWRRGYGKALVQGNLRADEARAVVAAVEGALPFAPLPAAERAAPRLAMVPAAAEGLGSLSRRDDPGGPGNPNNAVYVQFQNADRSLREQMAMEVIGAAMEQPFYAELRTRQQLGYIVFAGVKATEGVYSLNLVVQSAVAPPPDLAARALAFADGFLGTLEDMPDEQVRAYIDGLVKKKQERDKTLAGEASRHWSEISNGLYRYGLADRQAAALAALTKADLLDTYRRVVAAAGPGRRVFTSEVYAARDAAAPARAAPPPPGAVPVGDPAAFLAASELFPPPTGDAVVLASTA